MGRVALVTGGGRGIGRGIVTKCHQEGAQVVSLDIDPGQAESYAAAYGTGNGAPLPLVCDVTDGAQIARMIEVTRVRFRRIDTLVNNAGVNAYFEAVEMTEADWDGFMALDLKACWLCAKYALPHIRAAGGGAVINIASVAAIFGSNVKGPQEPSSPLPSAKGRLRRQ